MFPYLLNLKNDLYIVTLDVYIVMSILFSGVNGADFDACQTTVKKIFRDSNLNSELSKQYNIKLR